MAQTIIGPVVGGLEITGTEDRDRLEGDAGDDTIYGGDGKDRLQGLAGDDQIFGQDERDRLYGGEGCDLLSGGADDDRLDGGGDDDTLDGGAGDDDLKGRNGDDHLDGGADDDRLRGNDGNDTLIGGTGDDRLSGDLGDDVLYGGAGEDRLKGGKGNDLLDGGADDDQLYGGRGDDTLSGGAGEDRLRAGKGDDTLIYVLADNAGAEDRYDGDKGYDTLRIALTSAEWETAAVQAEITGLMDDLATRTDRDKGTGATEVEYRGKYELEEFGLTVSGIEKLVLVIDGVDYDMSDPVAMDDLLAGNPTGEVTINNDLTKLDLAPVAAQLSTGQIALAWYRNNAAQDGTLSGIQAQIINPDGSTAVAQIDVNTDLTGIKGKPAIAALSDGRFVVAWQSDADTGVSGDTSVMARVFYGDGSAAGDAFVLSDAAPGDDPRVDLAVLSNSSVLALWESADTGATQTHFSARFLDADGATSGSEFTLANPYSGSVLFPQVTALANGNALIVHQASQTPSDVSGFAVVARIVDDTGAEVLAPWTVNTETLSHQANPRATELSDGSLVVLWTTEDGGADPDIGIKARIFNPDGTEAVAEFLVNSNTDLLQHRAQILALESGQFVVAWRSTSASEAGGKPAIKARIFDADGTEAVAEFALSDSLLATQETPDLVALSGGRFLATWQNFGGASSQIVTRVFNTDGTEAATGLTDARSVVTLDSADWLVNDMDPDGDPLSLDSVDATGLLGTLTDLGGGLYDYDPRGAFDGLAAGDQATDSFTYTVSDGNGGTSTATVTIVIDGVALPLFSAGADVINFGGQAAAAALAITQAGDYLDGTQYDGLFGNDEVWLPNTLADAAAAGYDPTQVFNGGDGNDSIFAGALDDTINGGAGNDRIQDVSLGTNTLLGGADNDTFIIGPGDDYVDGEGGSNSIFFDRDGAGITLDIAAGTATGQGIDTVLNLNFFHLSHQNDVVVGSAAQTRVYLFDGDDQFTGGSAHELIVPDGGDDTVDGGDGRDQIQFNYATTGVTVDLGLGTSTGEGTDVLTNVEYVIGSIYDDLLIGDSTNTQSTTIGHNYLNGNTGNDTVYGLDGDDLLFGGTGDDEIYGGDGNDNLAGDAGQDTIDGGDGIDRLYGIQSSESMQVDLVAGTLTQFGTTDTLISIENVLGSGGDDTIIGDAGDNLISGWSGADVMTGGGGADEFFFDTRKGFTDTDIITDFEIGIDKVHVFGNSFAALADLNAVQVGADTHLTLVGETVVLQGILVGDLSDGDFIF